MKQRTVISLILLALMSCGKSKKELKRVSKDRLIGSDYIREWMQIDHSDNGHEEVEIYVTKKGDTLLNQYKLFRNGKLDMNQSEYYDLTISETDKPHLYTGKITFHSVYQNLNLNKANKRTVEFGFCEQTKDSISLKYIESNISNTIEFQFQNYYGKRLHGHLYQVVFRDTIINSEKMLNMRETRLIVDNLPNTSNLFIDSDSIKKERKFNSKKLKFVQK